MTTIIKAATAADFLALVPHLAGYTPTDSIALDPLPRQPHDRRDALRPAAGGRRRRARPHRGDLHRHGLQARGCRRRDPRRVHRRAVPGRRRHRARRARARRSSAAPTRAACTSPTRSASRPTAGARTSTRSARPRGARARSCPPSSACRSRATCRATRRRASSCRTPISPRRSASAARSARSRPPCGSSAASPTAAASMADLDPRAIAAVCSLDDIPMLFEDALRWDVDAPRALRRGGADVVPRAPVAARRRALAVGRRHGRGRRRARGAAPVGGRRGLPRRPRPRDVRRGPATRTRSDCRSALDLTRRLAAAAPRDAAAAMLATAGWLAWALGRSTYAHWHASRALEIDPDHGLAGIVDSFVGAGHLPEWAFERRRCCRPPCYLTSGKRIVSRMPRPVIAISRRSMPMPRPPDGGMPCSSARRNSSSMRIASTSPRARASPAR